MLIVGAKGFSKEVLEILYQLKDTENIVFFDDVNSGIPDLLYGQFKILKTKADARSYFAGTDDRFTLGLGGPVLRHRLDVIMSDLGGKLVSTISPKADIGRFDVEIQEGTNLMTGTVVTNSIKVGKGCLINLNCTIGHDCVLDNFIEMSPGVHISGNCNIGEFCNLGTNSTVLPKITIGSNVIVGAGAVVTKDVEDNSLVVGVPAVVKRKLEPIQLTR